jgi:protein-disulfide isomerase
VGPPVEEFQKRFPSQVRVVFKQFPLRSIHAEAQLAHEASLAAHAQGKFWEYHDLLFMNQQALSRADLESYAERLGLDMDKFRSDLDTGAHKAKVEQDLQECSRAGVSGTPTVLLNGARYQGPRGYPADGLEAVARIYLGLTDE